MPKMPENEHMGGFGSYAAGGYDPGSDDPSRGTLTTEQEEKNTVVNLKKNLLD